MRRSLWFLAALVIAILAYGGIWFATATFLRDQSRLWLTAHQKDGLSFSYSAPILTGFPLKAEVRFPDFTVSAPAVAQSPAWSWSTPAVQVYARPFLFDTFFLDLTGLHTLSGVTPQNIQIRAEEALAAFTLGKEGIAHANLQIANVEAPLMSIGAVAANIAVAAENIHTDLLVAEATLPDELPPPLTRTLKNLKLSVDVTGPIITGKPLPEVLEAWRSAGGTIELRDIAADWPPVSAAGSGTVALDRALQPEGAFTATFQGFLDVVDMLVTAGNMTPSQASVARGALALLSTTPHEGAPPELKLSVTTQGGKVYAGPVTLMELPAIVWPQNVVVP